MWDLSNYVHPNNKELWSWGPWALARSDQWVIQSWVQLYFRIYCTFMEVYRKLLNHKNMQKKYLILRYTLFIQLKIINNGINTPSI